VAIKVLSTTDRRRCGCLMRFVSAKRRRACLLNHPNIAGDLRCSKTTRATGADPGNWSSAFTLADRLAADGPARIADAIDIARQIADALDAAHESGIVHRDLKPGNIKITEDGRVKVLDFGLAKAIAAAAGESADFDPVNSPTITVHGTKHGVILGTAAYMSPEQARGKRIDKRTDIWAFGCVLFEMLTGSARSRARQRRM
jgi:serine/threonine-protein kinase